MAAPDVLIGHLRIRLAFLLRGWVLCSLTAVLLSFAAPTCRGQDGGAGSLEKPIVESVPSATKQQLPVNWLYGAYIPKEAPLETLSDADRWHLWVRQGFTTPGIWVKSGLFTISDQFRDIPPGWPQDAEGFGKRAGTRYAQFLMQDSFTAIGDAMPKWEPRYDLCRTCEGVGPRIKHAISATL